MAKIYKGALELIGHTPLMEIVNIEKELGLKARVLVKLEYLNPTGSVKDRAAKAMIEDAEQKGIKRRCSYYRTYFRKYRNRSCINRSSKRLSNDFNNAGYDECREKKYFEGLWSGDCADRRREGNERSH